MFQCYFLAVCGLLNIKMKVASFSYLYRMNSINIITTVKQHTDYRPHIWPQCTVDIKHPGGKEVASEWWQQRCSNVTDQFCDFTFLNNITHTFCFVSYFNWILHKLKNWRKKKRSTGGETCTCTLVLFKQDLSNEILVGQTHSKQRKRGKKSEMDRKGMTDQNREGGLTRNNRSTKKKLADKNQRQRGAVSSILAQVGSGPDIFSSPQGVCRCPSLQNATFPLIPLKTLSDFPQRPTGRPTGQQHSLWHQPCFLSRLLPCLLFCTHRQNHVTHAHTHNGWAEKTNSGQALEGPDPTPMELWS